MACQFVMSDVDGVLTSGENYTISVEFEGDTTDYLDNISFAIEWDTSLLELADFPDLEEYIRGSGFSKYILWGESTIPSIPDIERGRWYDISSETDLDHLAEFYPVLTGETHVATFTFTALQTGTFTDMVNFYFSPETNLTELVDINGTVYNAEDGDLIITKENNTSVLKTLYYFLSEIADQTTNIDTPTDPIAFTITPTVTGNVNVTGFSSNTALVPTANIIYYIDEQGTVPLTGPMTVTAGVPVTLYVTAIPVNSGSGEANITITVTDANDVNKFASAMFKLTVDLLDATLGAYGGTTTYKNNSPVLLNGDKARGSQILLKVGSGAPFEIVDPSVDGDWSYDWNITTDGTYDFSLINRAGEVEEVFATGTIIYDTVPPQVPVYERILTEVSNYSAGSGKHNVGIRAESPEGSDSNRFKFCLDGAKNGQVKNYGQGNFISPNAQDGVTHQAVAIPVDAAGNEQTGCTGNPVEWMLTGDWTEIETFQVNLAEPEQGTAYIELKWPVDNLDNIDDEVRVWAKNHIEDNWVELSGAAVQDANHNWWVLEDHNTPARIRSCKLTDASGNDTLVEFLRYDLFDRLPVATLNTYGGTTTRVETSPVTLSGSKEWGSQILLKIGSNNPFEIVASNVTGSWSYDWDIQEDGRYNFSLINRAEDMEEVIATGTIVLGTKRPSITPILMLLLEDE
ncbi:MAG: hypothetical protein JW927_13910 [Deltaproteobacteria bacterium]|nr:hypothetical protein [Deltaproteobacteria bacterium]